MKTPMPVVYPTILALSLFIGQVTPVAAQAAHDPGPRPVDASAGAPLPGMSTYEQSYFTAGLGDFVAPEQLGDGLGPRFNLDSCGGCHMQPGVGGSSPTVNPQVSVATAFGARNTVPDFITEHGPVREARFKYNPDGSRDGGVHSLFVISGRVDNSGSAGSCNIVQGDFADNRRNLSLRIPTPTFGDGLIEQIPASALSANLAANAAAKARLGIAGRFNHSGNDGTITRFGWKAQNASVLMFAGEAYNVEMGISNEIFPTEREQSPACLTTAMPNSVTIMNGTDGVDSMSSMQLVADFVRFLAPPAPSTTTPGGSSSIARGQQIFVSTGCALCHTQHLQTGNAASPALRNQSVGLFSDLALHRMGPGLADDIQQGAALGDEFRTAPLWGVGQRLFFLHDGRTSDLVQAINAHASAGNSRFGPSEANRVVSVFDGLADGDKQDLLNFLRSL